MPLPLISATEPSAFRSSMVMSAPSVPAVARRSPSAPSPVRRWQSATASSGDTGWVPSRSRSTRKSLPRPWCLVRRMRSRAYGCAQRVHEEVPGAVGGGLQPSDAGIASEPCPLAAGEAAGAADGEVHGLVEGEDAVQVLEELLVAERLTRGPGDAAGVLAEAAHLVEETGGHLLLVAGVDPGAEVVRLSSEADQGELGRGVGVEAGPVAGGRLAAAHGHLEGAEDAPAGGRLQAAGGQ